MREPNDNRGRCPVAAFERAEAGYAVRVNEWLGNPHAYFKSFGPEARVFQARNRSERLRTMTLVASAAELAELRPVRMSVDCSDEDVDSWEQVFALSVSRLMAAHPQTFAALQEAGELDWLGCGRGETSAAEVLEAGRLRPEFVDMPEVVRRVQWLFLMCGIRLNEVIVQVDPYDDDEWAVRHAEICRRRAADKAFLEGRKAAQRAWAAEHPDGVGDCGPVWDGTN